MLNQMKTIGVMVIVGACAHAALAAPKGEQ
jgi:hypothetical protein